MARWKTFLPVTVLPLLLTAVPSGERTANQVAVPARQPLHLADETTPNISLDFIEEGKKRVFVEKLLPLILKANKEVLKERAFVLSVKDKEKLSQAELQRLRFLFEKYRTTDVAELIRRVDAVPVSLILAQAAIESGWGTSRFFLEGNNSFGIYTYRQENCIKAKKANVCLKAYDSLYHCVEDYIYNMNVGWAYEDFRRAREKGEDVFTLAETLNRYSTAGKDYVRLVKDVIKKNRFVFLDLALGSAGFGR
jgi:Bax protein